MIYRLFKKAVYNRTLQIATKQRERLGRLQEVVEELRKWNDIPFSWQFEGLCNILKIKPNEAARNFLYDVILGQQPLDILVKRLPLI